MSPEPGLNPRGVGEIGGKEVMGERCPILPRPPSQVTFPPQVGCWTRGARTKPPQQQPRGSLGAPQWLLGLGWAGDGWSRSSPVCPVKEGAARGSSGGGSLLPGAVAAR